MYASDRERLFISILIAIVVWAGILLLLWRAELIPQPPDLSYQGPLEVVLDAAEIAEVSQEELPPVDEEPPREEAATTEEARPPSEEPSAPAESPSSETSLPQRETASPSQEEGETSREEQPLEGPETTDPAETDAEAGPASEEPPSEEAAAPEEDTEPIESQVIERSQQESGDSTGDSGGSSETSGEEAGEEDFFKESDDSRLEEALKTQPGEVGEEEAESSTGEDAGTEGPPIEEGTPENPVDPGSMGTNVILEEHPEPDIPEEYVKLLPPERTLTLSFIVSPGGAVSNLSFLKGGSGFPVVDEKIASVIKNDWKFNNISGRNVRVYLKYTIEKE